MYPARNYQQLFLAAMYLYNSPNEAIDVRYTLDITIAASFELPATFPVLVGSRNPKLSVRINVATDRAKLVKPAKRAKYRAIGLSIGVVEGVLTAPAGLGVRSLMMPSGLSRRGMDWRAKKPEEAYL